MRARKIPAPDPLQEVDRPSYCVHFGGGAQPAAGPEEWEVDDIDVDELLQWAYERRSGRTVTIWAIVSGRDGATLVRLYGHEHAA